MASACESCGHKDGCKSKGSCDQGQFEKLTEGSSIKTVIGISSGKGGVGKSFVTSMLATKLAKEGLKVGIMDADITGPSIPKAFGLKDKLFATDENKLIPAETKTGIKVVSLNLLLDNEQVPVVWRAPVITGILKQFWTEVEWGMLDVLLIDMPPGTADVPLTLFQSIPLDGIMLVSTPQDLVSMIVGKSRNMAQMMNIDILGLVENMSYVKCPHCDEKIYMFGTGDKVEKEAEAAGIPVIDKLPIDPAMAAAVDNGDIESIDSDILESAVTIVKGKIQ